MHFNKSLCYFYQHLAEKFSVGFMLLCAFSRLRRADTLCAVVKIRIEQNLSLER